MKARLLVLFVAACGDHTDIMVSPDAPPLDELAGAPSLGVRGLAGFDLEFGPTTRAIAQRADAVVFGQTRSSAPRVAAITTDDAAIVTVTQVTPDDVHFTVRLHAAGAGDTDLVLRDAGGVEIDRVTLHVRPSDTLAFDHPWGAGDPLVLAGEVELFHVSTQTAGVVTAGVGAVAFALAGDLTPATNADAPWFFGEGDHAYFRVGSAGGTMTADAPDTSVALALTIVAPSALTATTVSSPTVRFGAAHEGDVAIGATAGGTPVYGPRCSWVTAGLTIDLKQLYGGLDNLSVQSGWIGADPAFVYTIKGAPGSYDPTCTLPGGLMTTIHVQIDP